MADKNTILVVDDDPERYGFYWQIFNDDPEEFSPLPPQDGAPRQHPLVPHSLGDFSRFEEMFRQMVERGDRHPLCIVDMRFEKENNKDGAPADLRTMGRSSRRRSMPAGDG